MSHILICSNDSLLKDTVKGHLQQTDILDCGNSIDDMAKSIDNYVYLFGVVLTDSYNCTDTCIKLNKNYPNVRAAVAWNTNDVMNSNCNVVCIPTNHFNRSQTSMIIKQIENHCLAKRNGISITNKLKERRKGLIKVY